MKKIVLTIVFVILVVYMVGATAVTVPFYRADSEQNMKNAIARQVDGERYREETYIVTDKLEIKETGRYVIEAKWTCDTDMITGFVLLSEDGERKAYCTGNCVDMYTSPIELQPGTYDMSFYHIFNEKHEAAFEEKAGDEMNFHFEEVKGNSNVDGEYTLKMVAPTLGREVVYLVSMVSALMGSVLSLFELLLACTKRLG